MESILGRDDLRCPDMCLNIAANDTYYENDMECCFCNARPYWMINQTILGKLNIIFLEDGKPIIINESSFDSEFYSVYFQHGNLSFIPENICSFKNLVLIDLSYNAISDISLIACSVKIDTLILRGNKIDIVMVDLFQNLKFLRIVDLSHNNIKYIEPGLILNMTGSLSFFDVSHNSLTNVDVTNMVLAKQQYICIVNYSHNLLEFISNAHDWKINLFSDYGHGGYFDFTFNKFQYFIDFPYFGIEDITLLGKLYFYSYDFRYNEWICDCRFYPIVSKSKLPSVILDTDRINLKCSNPPEFKNKIIHTFYNGSLDLLICNISVGGRCPPKCHCFYQPNQDRTVVNCRSSLTSRKLPLFLPQNDNLFIDFSENHISDLDSEFQRLLVEKSKENYIKRIKRVNFAKNEITALSDFVIQILQNASMVNLSGNSIKSIPYSLRNINPCHIALGRLYITCICSDLWLQTWVPTKTSTCYINTEVFCYTDAGTKSIIDIRKSDLGCDQDEYVTWINVSLGISLAAIALISFVLYHFHIELFIVFRRYLKRNKNSSLLPSYMYDVYISCNEDDPDLRQWISNSLIPYLKPYRYRIFLPYRDSVFGVPREDEIMNVLSKTKNTLIILSGHYPKLLESWISHEWKYSWINYKKDYQRNIIVINYDMLDAKDISNKYIKAFVRLGKCIDFTNNEKNIGKTVVSSLGRPIAPIKYAEFRNTNVRFRPKNYLPKIFTNDAMLQSSKQ